MKFRTLGAVGYLAEGVLLIASALIFVYTYLTTATTAQVPSPAATSPFPGLAFAAVGEVVTFVPLALVSFAWFYAGREGRRGYSGRRGCSGSF